MLTRDAPFLWNQLRGLLCVYKPADTKTTNIRKTIISKICTELNQLDCRPPSQYVDILQSEGAKDFEIVVRENLADHPMVVGPRYLQEELVCSWSNYLGFHTSGVLLFGLRSGTSLAKIVRENHPTRAYKVKGMLGKATDNYYSNGKVIEKATYKHVSLYHIERVLAHMQAAHQKKMFELSGVDMQSQAAYELAKEGTIRPAVSKIPVLYGIKCVEFNSPHFVIEIQCVNEYETYLSSLIHEIGMKVHSVAHCTAIQCIRHCHFTLEHALLRKNWDLQHIITNVETCSKILQEHDSILYQDSATLKQ